MIPGGGCRGCQQSFDNFCCRVRLPDPPIKNARRKSDERQQSFDSFILLTGVVLRQAGIPQKEASDICFPEST